MRNIIYIIFLVAAGCSQNADISGRYAGNCGQNSDAVKYPVPWTKEVRDSFVIPDATVRSMSACGLLETWLTCPDRALGPWCAECSSLNIQGVSRFNGIISNDKLIIELFERENCISILNSVYQSVIKRGNEQTGQDACFEMLLASDICMSVSNDEERIQFMEMAITMSEKEKTHIRETRHIMVSVMKACDYMPFLTEAEKYRGTFSTAQTGLSEWLNGYDVCGYDVVEKYAKEFLNAKKNDVKKYLAISTNRRIFGRFF